jgi:CubicO group peptidase (beta-lactamase class C family)
VRDLESSDVIDQELWRAAVATRVAPVAVAGWATADRGEWGGAGADHTSVFDLGSVTKPCTALLLGLMHHQGELDLSRPLGHFLPELSDAPAGGVPLTALLRHEAGLVAHFRFYRESWAGRAVVRSAILRKAARLVQTPPGPVVYSDLGYILLGAVLERRSGVALDHLLAERLFGPLSLELGSARAFSQRPERRFVVTEVQPARGGPIQGQVHDDNAWALGGFGIAGHAGVFGTLRGVLGLGRILLAAQRGEGFLGDVLPDLLARPSPSGYSAGFMFSRGAASTAGALSDEHTFGHLGFPGASLWCDPGRGVATALLTNRVFPRRSVPRGRKTIGELRREFHDFLWTRSALDRRL